MQTYTYIHKNSADGFFTTAETEDEAWERLKMVMKDSWGWR